MSTTGPLTTIPNEGTTYKGWTLSQERVFIEELVHKRLTLQLAFVAITFAGASSANLNTLQQLGILVLGGLVTTALALATARAHEKLEIIIRTIKEADLDHPVATISGLASGRGRYRLVGVYTPFLTAGSVWLCAGVTLLTLLNVIPFWCGK